MPCTLLFEAVTMPVTIYSVAYPGARAGDAMVREFRDWILTEAAHQGALPNASRTAAA